MSTARALTSIGKSTTASLRKGNLRNASWFNHLDTAISIAEGGNRVYVAVKSYLDRKYSYNVTVNEEDSVYSEVHAWLVSVTPEERHRNLEVVSSKNFDNRSVSDDSSSDGRIKPLSMRFNESTTRQVLIEGYSVRVILEKPEPDRVAKEYGFRGKPATLTFTTRTYEGQQAVVRLLQKLNAQRTTDRKPVLKMSTQWGHWETRSDLPPRTMGSVSIPKDQKDRLTEDLKRFLESEEKYNRLAIPWHRGYMLYGPPGTGKTSLVKALANEFKMDLWYASLGDLSSENGLMDLLGRVSPRSILLLEDIDAIQITQDRDSAEQGKINTGSLLNALDGVGTPHGLITFMTTNNFDSLDEALKRTGRMDMVEHIQKPTLDTLEDLYQHFYGVEAVFDISEKAFAAKSYSASDFAEVMKRNMDDPMLAMYAIQEMF